MGLARLAEMCSVQERGGLGGDAMGLARLAEMCSVQESGGRFRDWDRKRSEFRRLTGLPG